MALERCQAERWLPEKAKRNPYVDRRCTKIARPGSRYCFHHRGLEVTDTSVTADSSTVLPSPHLNN